MFPENKLLQIYSLVVKYQIFAIYFANFQRFICLSGQYSTCFSCTYQFILCPYFYL